MKNVRSLCLLSFAFGSAVTLFICTFGPPPAVSVNAREHGEDVREWASTAMKPHPFGTLEAIEIPLANPDGTFPDREDRLRKPQWVFENISESELTAFLHNCPLKTEEKSILLDKQLWQIVSNGCVISPSEQLIWDLSPLARQRIYARLAESPRNYSQRFPFRFPENGFEERLKQSGLSLSGVEKLKTLSYTNEGAICFADLYSARAYLHPAEFNRLVETLCAVPVYFLRLRLDSESNVDEIVHYWGRGGREKLIAPLVTSIARVPGGGSLNISYLLPTFARLRVYTYPGAWQTENVGAEDCVFSALNFFNDTLNTNLFNRAEQARVLKNDYAPVQGEPALGDLVALLNSQNEMFHVCVYIADGFVFTKNGSNRSQPWIVMKLSDMLAMYESIEKPRTITYLRHKDSVFAVNR
jgi:hypothetical protein